MNLHTEKFFQDLGALRCFHVHCEGRGDAEDDTARDKVQVTEASPAFPFVLWSLRLGARLLVLGDPKNSISILVSSKLALN